MEKLHINYIHQEISNLTTYDYLNIKTLKNFYKIHKVIGVKEDYNGEFEPEIMIVWDTDYDEKDIFINKIIKEGVVKIYKLP